MTSRTVLVINSGSSSIKYQLVDPDSGAALASGLVERIGDVQGAIVHKVDGAKHVVEEPVPDHGFGLSEVLRLFDEHGPRLSEANIVAVGHRVVQGGKFFNGPALLTDEVVATIEELVPLGPLHNPAHLKGIEVARKLMSDIPQVAVFDTAFFQDLPEEAARYGLNREVADRYSIRRYGAHGTSHQYVSGEISKRLGRDDLKQIVLHLGNGASVSAVVGAHAVETSMGLTPLEGLVMGGRTGDIDPAAVFHLVRVAGLSVDEIDHLFNRESGMKGLTGESDMREVTRMMDEGNQDAIDAMNIYLHRLTKYVGAYTAVMGGLDAITFTAGIGENDGRLRAALCERLAYLGVRIDAEANARRSEEPVTISTPESSVVVTVLPTNEELAIARQALSLI
ncbi:MULTISPECIES: acetate kinase [unclassified Actinomyces]|uniref:acetate/propionate family kinase n=2 Tax=Actinomyces TaxID=1654 RepID=UPI00201700B6|nr:MULTISPECIES: acetate kinase [unclassified Actinomyces]MCL3777592.1 acetate kinase [Actinomyces sp. AC-20-1]MCL3790495.1 acetate kinase [Actinomyces sp. 187325]MCL3791208.1 acetate kinase [Actinomyces sp. 186855]MCL3794475.1 acetate kinase [Actinomyces sp. 217892]